MGIRNKQPDADAGRVIVDDQLSSLEKDIARLYAQTGKDVQSDMQNFMAKFAQNDASMRAKVKSNEITLEDYINWRERTIWRTDAMKAKVDDLTQRMVHADKQAMAMVNNELPEIYATSYNFGGFRGETYANAAGFDYTQFTVINQDAVKILI